jgi:hypothetical protein
MQWAIHVADPSEIKPGLPVRDVESLADSPRLRPVVSLAASLIDEYFGPVTFTRAVFGNEFCEHLIPDRARLERIVEAARRASIELTFLTPYVSDAGIEKLVPLFEMLDQSGRFEVVFNDWGVLNLLRREFPRITRVQGRLMNKSLRDPRVTGVYAASEAPTATLVSLRRSSLDSSSYTNLLSDLGVTTVEIDNLPQGNDLGFTEDGLAANAYVPFGFVSTSRICMAAGLHYSKREKFQPGAACHHECQTHLVEYGYTNSPFGNRDQKFYLKGNTYFYAHSEAMLRGLFEQARAGLVGGLIFQPRLPMTWQREPS